MKKVCLALFLLLSTVAFFSLNGNSPSSCKNGCFTNVTYSAYNFTLPINKWVEYCSLTPVPGLGISCAQASSESQYDSCVDQFCPFLRPFTESVGNLECTGCLSTAVSGESRTSRIFKCSGSYIDTDAAACQIPQQRRDLSVLDGSWANFVSPGVGGPGTVDWQQSLDNGMNFSSVAGATAPTYSLQALLALSGNLYRAAWFNGSASLRNPTRLTVTPPPPAAPQLFVSNGGWYGMVEQFDAAIGSFTSNFAPLDTPKGIALHPSDGSLLVVSSAAKRIVRFNGHTAAPMGIFADGTVACAGLALNGPAGIAFGPDSHLYVADTNNNRVVKYDGVTGACLNSYASGSTLNRPNSLVFGRDGYLYVANLNGSVARFEPGSGAAAGVVNVGTSAGGIAISPLDDNLYVTDRVLQGQVYSISRSNFGGATPSLFISNSGSGLGYPEGLAFGPDNQLYVASNSQNRIQRFDASTGAFLSTFVNNTPTGFEPTFLAFGALPTIRWNNPVSVSFGSALSSAQLNASANVPGTFVYTPPAGTVLPVGSAQTLSVQFTPAVRNYRPSTASVPITVTGGGPATLISTNTLRREAGTNNVIVTVRIANTGGTPATSVVMTSARIGATTAITSLPASVGNIAAGGVSFVMLSFPPSVGAAGARVVLSTGGTYSSGSFGQSARVVLP